MRAICWWAPAWSAGCVPAILGLEIFGFAPMYSYFANRGEIDIIEETEASLAQGLRATLANVGFMPGRAWLGTDLPRLRPDVKTVIDPYSGETLMAFPAIRPDIAVIHALIADTDGNALIGDNKGVDEELALTGKNRHCDCRADRPRAEAADIVAPLVDFIVLAPHGALPTSCHPFYPLDGESILQYTEQVSDPASCRSYLERLVKGLNDAIQVL